MTTIQSGCDAPPDFKNRTRAMFLQPVPQGTPVPLGPLRNVWSAIRSGEHWTFSDHKNGFLSTSADGSVVDTFPVDDGSGRQRWVLEPLGPADTYALRNAGGMTTGAPRYVGRAGNFRTKMRADPRAEQSRWIVTGLSAAPKPAAAAPPAAPPPPNGSLKARDVLLQKRGKPLRLLRESPQFCIWADQGDGGAMQEVVDNLEVVWKTYAAMKFSPKPEIVASQGWAAHKKSVYLSGTTPPGPCCACPESGHGYEYQGWEGGNAFLVTGGFGPKGGCAAHELGHLMQCATGGFNWGGTCPWAWESGAQFMRWHGCPTEEDSESLRPWLKNHSKSIERNEGDSCYHYGSWFLWMFLDGEFGAGTTGRIWSEARAPESPLEASARIAGVSVPDLFARWVGALLTQRYTSATSASGSERWDRVNRAIGHADGWATFDALREEGGAYVPADPGLERNGFHALRLSDGKARGPRRLRLDPASPDPGWRMVVVSGKDRNKNVQVLKAGQESLAVFLADTVIGVCATGPTSADAQRYRVTLT